MYFSNSQERRDLPIPATPITETRWALRSSDEVWKSSLIERSSRSRPTKGASRPECRSAPPREATTRRARHSGTGPRLPLAPRGLGVVPVGRGWAPDRHHGVSDEFLDGPAVPRGERPARVEVTGEEFPHLVGIASFGEGGEAHQVGEQHGDQSSFGNGNGRR